LVLLLQKWVIKILRISSANNFGREKHFNFLHLAEFPGWLKIQRFPMRVAHFSITYFPIFLSIPAKFSTLQHS